MYIGSSVNLGRRLRTYFDFSYLSVRVQKSKSRIYSAILKHGYSNFQLEILEYCRKENVLNRVSSPARRLKRGDYLLEQYYIDFFKAEYNLNSTAGSRLGSIHSEETKRKMSNFFQGRKLTEQTKNLLSLANKGMNNPNFGKTHSAKTKALIRLARLGKSILSESMKEKMSTDSGTGLRVLDLTTNKTSVYRSITRAAKAMGVSQAAISKRFKDTTRDTFIIKKRYKVVKVEVSNS